MLDLVFHNPDAQCLPEMLARAWAVSEEIDTRFINLVYKLALSRRSLLFTLVKLYM